MSLCHRVKVAALVGGMIAATLTGISYLNQRHKTNFDSNRQIFFQKNQETPRSARAVLRDKTPVADQEPSRDVWRQENDLKAQREMADWAFLMVIISFFNTAITATGVWFVRETLRATQGMLVAPNSATKAAEDVVSETRRIGEAQVQAYVAPVKGECLWRDNKPSRLILFFANSGQSPALNCEMTIDGLTGRSARFVIPANEKEFPCHFDLDDTSQNAVSSSLRERQAYPINGRISFQTVFDKPASCEIGYIVVNDSALIPNVTGS